MKKFEFKFWSIFFLVAVYTVNVSAINSKNAAHPPKTKKLSKSLKHNSYASDAFVTVWQTTYANEPVVIPTTPSYYGDTYNYTVDWGDGTTSTGQTGNAIHNYPTAGIYTVAITGTFPRIYFYPSGSTSIRTIEQWGINPWTSMRFAFTGCVNLRMNATDVPNLSNVTDMSGMFSNDSSFNGNINNWDVSNVTDMSSMFALAFSFNQNLSNWIVSHVTDMSGMFDQAHAFNQDLSSWDVSNVTNMSGMFGGATNFNQNLNGWTVTNVTDMSFMFNGAKVFNQNLNSWDVSNVIDMGRMFLEATVFNGIISDWNVGQVKNMLNMFRKATAFDQDISSWNVSNVTNMSAMFYAAAFNLDLNNWNVSNVTNMNSMFAYTTSFNGNISSWNVSNVTNMDSMFSSALSFNQDLSRWDVSNVTTMSFMFAYATAFDQDLGSWDISNVTGMYAMFNNNSLSTPNYDNTLIGWSTLSAGETKIPTGITFDGGNSKYCAGEAARNTLTSTDSWIITDGGKDCSNTTLWTGATNTDWNTSSNWDNGIPTTSLDAVIPITGVDAVNEPVIHTAGMVCNSLNIFSGTSLTINSGKSLTINGNLDNNGTFTLNSDATTSGSLIVTGTSTGNITYNRYMTGGSDWHLIAASIGGQDINNFVTNGANNILISGVDYKLTPYSNSFTFSNPSVWTHWTTDATNPATGAGNFIAGKGYKIMRATDGIVNFSGTVPVTNVSIAITKPASNNAWNLIGNPFPSSIYVNSNADAANNFMTINSSTMDASYQAIYLWNPTSSSTEAINQASVGSYLSPGQAYFVRSVATGATVNFTTAMRTNQVSAVFQKIATTPTPTITLKVTKGSVTKNTQIKYLSSASLGLDPGYDAGLFDLFSPSFNIYSKLVVDNGVNFMLQSVPDNAYNTTVIPIGIDAVAGSQITFSTESTDLPSVTQVILEDRLLGTSNEINNTDKTYTITLAADSNGIGRFYVHTIFTSTLDVNDYNPVNSIKLYPNPSSNRINLNGDLSKLQNINIYSIIGNRVLSINKNFKSINIESLNSGIYIVNLMTKDGTKSLKFIKE